MPILDLPVCSQLPPFPANLLFGLCMGHHCAAPYSSSIPTAIRRRRTEPPNGKTLNSSVAVSTGPGISTGRTTIAVRRGGFPKRAVCCCRRSNVTLSSGILNDTPPEKRLICGLTVRDGRRETEDGLGLQSFSVPLVKILLGRATNTAQHRSFHSRISDSISVGFDRILRRRFARISQKRRCFRHQLLLPRPYLVLTNPLRLDIQCQRAASVKIGWKYLDD